MDKLTKKQQQMVEESVWVVHTCLAKLGETTNEDLRQIGYMYLCNLVTRYDHKKGAKWTTYAYSCMLWHLSKHLNRQRKVENRQNELFDCCQNEEIDIETMIESKDCYSILTEQEKEFAEYRAVKLTYKEIADKMNMSVPQLKRLEKGARCKIIAYLRY